MKVYCKDCKYYCAGEVHGFERCFHPRNWIHEADENYLEVGDFGHKIWEPKNQNKNNDCKEFTSRWHKRRKYRNR